MLIQKLASAVRNDVVSGLAGYHSSPSMSIEQIEDEIVETRLAIIKEYQLKGIVPTDDLMLSINCINVDCKDLDKCGCRKLVDKDPIAHFELPQLLMTYGIDPIDYLGSTDRQLPFNYYTSLKQLNYSQYRKRKQNVPYVYIDTTPNENKMYDCYIFNGPLLKQLSIVAIFKDPRQLEMYKCCTEVSDDNMSFIDSLIKDKLTKQKIYYYRQLYQGVRPNDQSYKP